MWFSESKDQSNTISQDIWTDIAKLEAEIQQEYNISKEDLYNLCEQEKSKNKDDTFLASINERKQLIETLQARDSTILFANNTPLNTEQYEALADKITHILKLQSQTQSEILLLRTEINEHIYETQLFSSNSLATKNWYSEKTLERIDNPQKISDHFLWLWISSAEWIYISWKFLWDTWKWFIRFPYDTYQVLTRKAELDTNIKV